MGSTHAGCASNCQRERSAYIFLCTNLRPEHADIGLYIADGHVECARLLLDHGASVAAVCERGRTPLHHAALADEATTVRLLLDAGASLEQPDKNGVRPLDWACSGHGKFGDQIRFDQPDAPLLERMGTVNCLLAAGADPNVSSDSGDTPLHKASKHDDQDCPVRPMQQLTIASYLCLTAYISLPQQAHSVTLHCRSIDSISHPHRAALHAIDFICVTH